MASTKKGRGGGKRAPIAEPVLHLNPATPELIASPNVLLPFARECTYYDRASGTQMPVWPLVKRVLAAPPSDAAALDAALRAFRDPGRAFAADSFNNDHLMWFVTKSMSGEERTRLYTVTLPFMASLVLQMPDLFPAGLPILVQDVEQSVLLSQRQCACLLAAQFFSLIPDQCYHDQEFPSPCMSGAPGNKWSCLFERYRKDSWGEENADKLRCVLHFFHRLSQEPASAAPRSVLFTRQVLAEPPLWESTSVPLCKVQAPAEGRIEDQSDCAQVDFANEMLGGGIMQRSTIQEQILFMIYPELFCGMVFTPRLLPHEALVVRGVERFANYTGYARSFRFAGSHVDPSPRDARGLTPTTIIAIDAFNFHHGHREHEQFHKSFLLRELNKAYVGYRLPKAADDGGGGGAATPVASGNWGCGVFAGDAAFKALLQILACSLAGRDLRLFFFEKVDLPPRLDALMKMLSDNGADTGSVYRALLRYDAEAAGRDAFEFVAAAVCGQSLGLASTSSSSSADVSSVLAAAIAHASIK